MDKRDLRAAMKAVLRGIPEPDLAARSRLVARRLAETAAWRSAGGILCFLSMPHELSTEAIIGFARDEGKAVAVPRIVEDELAFLLMPADARELPRDRWGIPVPDPEWPELLPSASGRLLVASPGLAFDREGNRLGRGRGFYDRFLAKLRGSAGETSVIGVCLSEQVLSAVPHEDFDQPMDGLVTENETILFRGPRRAP